jgi:DNA modification methylase
LVSPTLLDEIVRRYLPEFAGKRLSQTDIPRLAKEPRLLRAVARAVKAIPTEHRFHLGDSRGMAAVPDDSVHLIVTSPP